MLWGPKVKIIVYLISSFNFSLQFTQKKPICRTVPYLETFSFAQLDSLLVKNSHDIFKFSPTKIDAKCLNIRIGNGVCEGNI